MSWAILPHLLSRGWLGDGWSCVDIRASQGSRDGGGQSFFFFPALPRCAGGVFVSSSTLSVEKARCCGGEFTIPACFRGVVFDGVRLDGGYGVCGPGWDSCIDACSAREVSSLVLFSHGDDVFCWRVALARLELPVPSSHVGEVVKLVPFVSCRPHGCHVKDDWGRLVVRSRADFHFIDGLLSVSPLWVWLWSSPTRFLCSLCVSPLPGKLIISYLLSPPLFHSSVGTLRRSSKCTH